MTRYRDAILDTTTGIWGLGFVPAWLVCDPTFILEYQLIVQFWMYVFATLASVFTVVWTALRIYDWVYKKFKK